ncbi:hypothetical protein GALL_412090 [mine drainage metagenome]|uniref:Abi-like protein n=1 Tax=mine drainage metagenome TaxID=410659 RepID=A0A1J5Q054_9ZZZZ
MRWVGIFGKHSTYMSGTSPCQAHCLRQSPWLKWLYETRSIAISKHGRNRAGQIGWTSRLSTKRAKLILRKLDLEIPKNPSHGKVLAELNFGFWRFLVANRYLHTIWIPTMNSAFPKLEGRPGERREIVERSIERLWFLRNRIGHHEPIHARNIERDTASMTFLLDWICPDTSAWAAAQRRVQQVLLRRPGLK